MPTILAQATDRPEKSRDGDDLSHVFCQCDPDLALCGRDITGEPKSDEVDWVPDEDTCVVCDDLTDSLCPRCGA